MAGLNSMDVILFAPGRDERIANVGVVLVSRGDATLLWIPLYDPRTGGLRPWGTVALVPVTDIIYVEGEGPEEHVCPQSLR